MQNTFFRYFKEGDAVENNGQTHRVICDESAPYLVRKLDGSDLEVTEGKTADEARAEAEAAGDTFKFKEVTFNEWLDGLAEDTRKAMVEGCDEGTFLADVGAEEGLLVCSLETGEPVEATEEEAEAAA
jgi:hypothetical protein